MGKSNDRDERIVPVKEVLELRRSLSICRAIEENPFATLLGFSINTKAGKRIETVRVRIEVQRPQKVAHDIRGAEEIAVQFSLSDDWYPEVLALRTDFPFVAHLNLRESEFPRSLCLYEEPWEEVRLRWNGVEFLERIREWLRLTALGELHQQNQPLEPLMLSSGYRLVVSREFDESASGHGVPLVVATYDAGVREPVLVASKISEEPRCTKPEQKYLLFKVTAPAVSHGLIRQTPKNLQELSRFTDREGFSLVEWLRERLKAHPIDETLERRFVLMIDFPKSRSIDGGVESIERKAFMTFSSVGRIGELLGVWGKVDGVWAPLIGPVQPQPEEINDICVLNVTSTCDWNDLAYLNGEARSNALRITAIGAGALGSQVACNLARSGFGRWTIIDNDTMLPHNAARHAANAVCVGIGKAPLVSSFLNCFADASPIADFLGADVLQPGANEAELSRALAADVVLDMSASVAVARKLSDQVGKTRIASLFLNPSGTDLVFTIEDCARNIPLNHLEMQYYWAAAVEPQLAGHAKSISAGNLRYGGSCRDVSNRIPHDFVALHAANGARQLRRRLDTNQAAISVFRYDPSLGNMSAIDIHAERFVQAKIGDWTLCAAPTVLRTIKEVRENALPLETGGVLIGGVDFDRNRLYLVGLLPAPDDSEQYPDGFIRGSRMLSSALEDIEERTFGNLGYLGEWHSHPDSMGTNASDDDKQLFDWIGNHTVHDGRPPMMIIAGEGGAYRVFLDRIEMTKIIREPTNSLASESAGPRIRK